MRLSSWRWKAIIPVSGRNLLQSGQSGGDVSTAIQSTCLLLAVVPDGWVPVCRDAGRVACCGQGCWELQAVLGCVNEHSLPASALQRGLKMVWARIIAMGTFSACCFTGGGVGRETRSLSLPLLWYLSCAAGILGGLWPKRAAQVTTGWKDEWCLQEKVIQHVLWQQIWEYPCSWSGIPENEGDSCPLSSHWQAPEHQFSKLCLGHVHGEQTVPSEAESS